MLSPIRRLSCIWPTDIAFRYVVNPLEIARVRVSKDLLTCAPGDCGSPDRKPVNCSRCLPTRNVPALIFHIARREGWMVLLTGIQSNLKMGFVRSGIFYPLYEFGKFINRKFRS